MSIKNFTLRPYQSEIDQRIVDAWASGAKNVLAVLPTGAGKSVLLSGIVAREPGYTCVIAHRKELVCQLSMAMNKRQVPHWCAAPDATVRWIISQHMVDHGYTCYQPNSRCMVAGVNTLTNRKVQMTEWGKRVALWVQDECHHQLRKNQWGKAAELFPNARGLGVTATPERGDGAGLGRHADGLMDVMIVGPSGRDLINMGYLTDYRIFAPPSDINLEGVTISAATGDYVQPQMVERVKQSHIIGDVVQHYLRIAPGKLGITFVPSVDIGAEVALAFSAAGVPAEVVSAKTPNHIRAEATRRLRRGDLKQLVNVDIFGEGFDLPAIEVVSFARPTASYGLYAQQFGRVLRIMDGKTTAYIIDHVGNVMRHGLPDAPRQWTLNRRERRSSNRDPQAIPMRVCTSCTGVYEATYAACPYCGAVRVIADRSRPEFVDGDLTELDPSYLAALRGEIEKIDRPAESVRGAMLRAGAPPIAALGAAKQHRLRSEQQTALREAIAMWAGWQRHMGRPDAESYKRFYWRFGTDVMTAQTLGRPEAERLTAEINSELGR